MKKKLIAVTGGNRGIGSAISRDLARRGFDVACLSRKGNGIEDAQLPADMAARIHPYACDITDRQSVDAAFDAITETHGGLDGLVNNAGIHLDGPSADFESSDFEKVLRTNVVGPFTVAQAAYSYLKNSAGLIVNIGSFYDRAGVPSNTAYCASKAAVAAVSRCLAVEWAKDGIRVLTVAPGFVATDLNREYLEQEKFQRYLQSRIPLKRPAQPEEIGQLVGSLFEEDMKFLTGETLYIDGGQGIGL